MIHKIIILMNFKNKKYNSTNILKKLIIFKFNKKKMKIIKIFAKKN